MLGVQYVAGNLTAWRWVMLVGLLVPTYWVGEGLAQGLEAAIEWNFFENRRVLYYFIGTTVSSAPHCKMRFVRFWPVKRPRVTTRESTDFAANCDWKQRKRGSRRLDVLMSLLRLQPIGDESPSDADYEVAAGMSGALSALCADSKLLSNASHEFCDSIRGSQQARKRIFSREPYAIELI